ncbi:alpha/beta hydrolase [Enemella sp. A6]|uniref:alpha/beta hydrolase n=1 Tax=Enemella sp. A6 TaxID=3440152 RepID=UPI003EBA62C5
MSFTYDREVAAFVPYAPPVDATKVDQTREMLLEFGKQKPVWNPGENTEYSVHEVPGVEGAPAVEVHVLRTKSGNGDRPALLWFHGGGFVLGDARESLPFLEPIVTGNDAVAVSVQYRLSPETHYPGPLDDGYAAYSWLRDNAAELGVDPGRIAVGGQSAGGALAAGLAQRVRDEGGSFCFQLLDIPVTDDRGTTESATDYTDSLVWHRTNAEASWRHYLGETSDAPAYAAPNRAEDLSGLPPAFITVNQFDPLRDEGMEYARRLAHAGVLTELHMYPGTFHGSASMAPTAQVSLRQIADLHAAIGRAFSSPSEG